MSRVQYSPQTKGICQGSYFWLLNWYIYHPLYINQIKPFKIPVLVNLKAEMKRMRDRKMQSMINKLLDAVNSETQEKYDFKSPLQLVLKGGFILIFWQNRFFNKKC